MNLIKYLMQNEQTTTALIDIFNIGFAVVKLMATGGNKALTLIGNHPPVLIF